MSQESDAMKIGAESVRIPRKVYGSDGAAWAAMFKADPMRTAPGGAGALVVEHYETAIRLAMLIIETGDQRLLASDGPAGGQPPELSLEEWQAMYRRLKESLTPD